MIIHEINKSVNPPIINNIFSSPQLAQYLLVFFDVNLNKFSLPVMAESTLGFHRRWEIFGKDEDYSDQKSKRVYPA